MKTHLPVPERTLPPESARRIRSTITADRLEDDARWTTHTWLVPLAAALVLIALMATAVVLWPNAARTEVAATPSVVSPTPADPSVVELSSSPTAVDPQPPFVGPPEPQFRSSANPTSGPTSPTDVFETDRGSLASHGESTPLEWCAGEVGSPGDGATSRYARRVSDGQVHMVVVVFQLPDGSEWICGPNGAGPLFSLDPPRSVPSDKHPVVVEPGPYGGGEDELSSDFLYAGRPGVERVQARAVINGKPQPWFEAEVHGGLAYLPMFNTGRLIWTVDTGLRGVRFEHRAFDADGDEVPVKVLREQGR